MSKLRLLILCALLSAAPAQAQDLIGYTCGMVTNGPFGMVTIVADLDTNGALTRTGARWAIVPKGQSDGQMAELDYAFPADDPGKPPFLQRAAFTPGGATPAPFTITLNSGERWLSPPILRGSVVTDRAFLDALTRANAIAFDLTGADGSPLGHRTLEITEEDRNAATAALTRFQEAVIEKMKDYRARCGKVWG